MNRRDRQLLEIEKMKAYEAAICICHAAIVMVLRKEYRFGEQRLIRVLEGMAEELAPVENGMIGWRNYVEYVKETVGVNIIEPELYKED